jgi:L-aminopeptidase/D-esterase-like protein
MTSADFKAQSKVLLCVGGAADTLGFDVPALHTAIQERAQVQVVVDSAFTAAHSHVAQSLAAIDEQTEWHQWNQVHSPPVLSPSCLVAAGGQ